MLRLYTVGLWGPLEDFEQGQGRAGFLGYSVSSEFSAHWQCPYSLLKPVIDVL